MNYDFEDSYGKLIELSQGNDTIMIQPDGTKIKSKQLPQELEVNDGQPMPASMTRRERRGQEPTITPMEGLQQFGEAMGGALTGLLPGAVAGSVGTPGDLAGIFAGAYEAATAEEGESLNAFLQTLTDISGQYGSEAALNFGRSIVEDLPVSDQVKEGMRGGLEAGSFVGIGGTATKGGKAIVEGARRYIAGAPERVAERGTGMTLQSGVDPMAAVDEAIVGFGRAREVKLPTAEEPGIIVFHGSGSDFDKFQLSKIGTGEGNQAFGRGLYFTDLEDIAKFYRDAMGVGKEVTYKGRKLKDIDSDAIPQEDQLAVMVGQQDTKEAMQILIEREMTTARKDLAAVNQAISDFETNPEAYPLKIFGMPVDMDQALEVREFNQKRMDAAKEVEKNIDSISAKPAGRIYKAKLKVDPKKLLDYDKPIAAQNSFVRGKIEELVQEVNLDDALNLGFDPFEMGEEAALQAARESLLDSEVLTFLNTWRDIRGVEGAAEELLDKYGIKGIKYKAMQGAGARNVPETGAQNYVIFDENLIDIMKKYGIVGSVAVSSMAATQGDQDQGDLK